MKQAIKMFGLLSLIVFSFFYTDKVMDVVLEEDKIMIEINENKDKYQIDSINAQIENEYMIPGINGKEVDINKSYSNLKNVGIFLENYLVYKDIKPQISMYENYDKYIKKGNSKKNKVSFITIISNQKEYNKLKGIEGVSKLKLNIYIDSNYLNENPNIVKENTNFKYYTYGINGEYIKDNLIYSKNLIERLTNNKDNYCLSKEINNNIKEICKENEMFTIIPNIIIKNNIYNEIIDKLSSGDIILFNIENIKNVNIILNYINGKGIEVAYLDELLNEELN